MLSPEWLEILAGYRTIDIEGIKYDILLPTLQILHDSSFYIRHDNSHNMFSTKRIEELKKVFLSEEDIKLLDTYEDKLEGYHRDLEIQTSIGKRQTVKNRTIQLEEQVDKIENKWQQIKGMSVEGFSSIVQVHYCFYRGVRYTETKEFLWKSYEDFLDDTNGGLIRLLLNEYILFTNSFTDKRLRDIAKDAFYRVVTQLLQTNLTSMFKSTLDMSLVAIKLSYWLTYYINTLQYANEECPSDILEDDDSFDNWARRQRKGITDESTTTSSSRIKGKSRESVVVSG